MNFDSASLSEQGPRAENEDSIINEEFRAEYLLIGVADGLGGHEGGKTASRLAIGRLQEAISKNPETSLARIATSIHSELREMQSDNKLRGMATTLSAALIHQMQLTFVHCGDSRIAVALQ